MGTTSKHTAARGLRSLLAFTRAHLPNHSAKLKAARSCFFVPGRVNGLAQLDRLCGYVLALQLYELGRTLGARGHLVDLLYLKTRSHGAPPLPFQLALENLNGTCHVQGVHAWQTIQFNVSHKPLLAPVDVACPPFVFDVLHSSTWCMRVVPALFCMIYTIPPCNRCEYSAPLCWMLQAPRP